MVRLTERLNTVGGVSSEGRYAYEVETWRADVLAVANLRVRLLVYRVRSRPWFLPDARREVYRETEVASESSVAEHVEDMREHGRQVAERYENELSAATGADTSGEVAP